MKLLKTNQGYLNLITDEGNATFCIHKQPASTIMPDKLQRPQLLELYSQSSFCGTHCPFFQIEKNHPAGAGKLIRINCQHNEVIIGASEIVDEKNNKPKLID